MILDTTPTSSTGGGRALHRTAAACRREHALQLWSDGGGPLDATDRIPAGSSVPGVYCATGRTALRERPIPCR